MQFQNMIRCPYFCCIVGEWFVFFTADGQGPGCTTRNQLSYSMRKHDIYSSVTQPSINMGYEVKTSTSIFSSFLFLLSLQIIHQDVSYNIFGLLLFLSLFFLILGLQIGGPFLFVHTSCFCQNLTTLITFKGWTTGVCMQKLQCCQTELVYLGQCPALVY